MAIAKSPMPFVGPSHMWPEIHFPAKAPSAWDARLKFRWWHVLLIFMIIWMLCCYLIPVIPTAPKATATKLEDHALQQRVLATPMVKLGEPKAPANTAYMNRMRAIINRHGQPVTPLPTNLGARHSKSED